MGYHIQEQKPSGAVALIASGNLVSGKSAVTGPDTVATSRA